MPVKKLLVEFLADFVRDETVRCKTLRHERRGPADYGLDPTQVAALNTFDLDIVMKQAAEELKAIGVDLKAKKREIIGGAVPGSFVDEVQVFNAVGAAMYSGGQIHIRRLEPDRITAGKATTIVVLGNGFDSPPEIQFELENSTTTVRGVVKATSCDVDLYQRVTVEVTLTAGTWTVRARNTPAEAWNTKDVGKLEVVAA